MKSSFPTEEIAKHSFILKGNVFTLSSKRYKNVNSISWKETALMPKNISSLTGFKENSSEPESFSLYPMVKF